MRLGHFLPFGFFDEVRGALVLGELSEEKPKRNHQIVCSDSQKYMMKLPTEIFSENGGEIFIWLALDNRSNITD